MNYWWLSTFHWRTNREIRIALSLKLQEILRETYWCLIIEIDADIYIFISRVLMHHFRWFNYPNAYYLKVDNTVASNERQRRLKSTNGRKCILLSIDSVIQYQFQIAISQRWNRVTIRWNTVSRTNESEFWPDAIVEAF